MAYDLYLEERLTSILERKKVPFSTKKMMGGLCYMVDDKMCIGIVKDELMARVGPEQYDECLTLEGCREMNFTGRAMKGFVFVDSEAIDQHEALEMWVQKCLDYNPMAKKSKKKKKT